MRAFERGETRGKKGKVFTNRRSFIKRTRDVQTMSSTVGKHKEEKTRG